MPASSDQGNGVHGQGPILLWFARPLSLTYSDAWARSPDRSESLRQASTETAPTKLYQPTTQRARTVSAPSPDRDPDRRGQLTLAPRRFCSVVLGADVAGSGAAAPPTLAGRAASELRAPRQDGAAGSAQIHDRVSTRRTGWARSRGPNLGIPRSSCARWCPVASCCLGSG